jgi:decaprenylphospho-beta-D-erythro-pentofuranosid-2-ulose 2-reductase
MNRILIVGATSAIAEATARLYAADGERLFLSGRDAQKLAAIAADLRIRGAAQVDTFVLDSNDSARHGELIDSAHEQLGGLDIALIAYGSLPDQSACEASFELTRQALETNFISVLSLLSHLANTMQAQGHGVIAAISSVAGDRGRQSNYIYGAAKGGVSLFLQGLRNRLHRHGVAVVTIKPGFVDTPMTRDFKKGLLWATPPSIAKGIYKAIDKRTPVAYLPGFWRWIMLIIRLIPERLFRSMTL